MPIANAMTTMITTRSTQCFFFFGTKEDFRDRVGDVGERKGGACVDAMENLDQRLSSLSPTGAIGRVSNLQVPDALRSILFDRGTTY